MTKTATNLKVAQGQQTIQKLLTIAEKVFAKQGYSATTTQEIIAKAKVTKGALYHHFPSKKHLFAAVYRPSGGSGRPTNQDRLGGNDGPLAKAFERVL